MSVMVLFIGLAAIAGAVEQNTSIVLPALITLAGIIWTIHDKKRMEDEEKSDCSNLSNSSERNNESKRLGA